LPVLVDNWVNVERREHAAFHRDASVDDELTLTPKEALGIEEIKV